MARVPDGRRLAPVLTIWRVAALAAAALLGALVVYGLAAPPITTCGDLPCVHSR